MRSPYEVAATSAIRAAILTRLVNEMDPDAPSPFHLYGTDRFLVLAREVVAEPNLISWDIVLVRAGQTPRACSRRWLTAAFH